MNSQLSQRADLPPDPHSNTLKTGTAADCPRVPEDADAINLRTIQWYDSLRPQNLLHCYFVGQVVVTSLRIEHLARIDRRTRDRGALQAKLFWDDDRRLEAEVLGAGLSKSPAAVVNQLRRTPQGCNWMIGRWSGLARAAEGSRDATMIGLAFDLLGAYPEARDGKPGDGVDLAQLATVEIEALEARKVEVAAIDALDRSMVEADYRDEPSPSSRSLRRHDNELHRRLKWFLAQFNVKPLHGFTPAGVLPYFNDIALPARDSAQPADQATVPSAVIEEVENETPEIEIESVPEPEHEVIVEIPPVPEVNPKRRKVGVRKPGTRREDRKRRIEPARA